jgi:hypothetical protein
MYTNDKFWILLNIGDITVAIGALLHKPVSDLGFIIILFEVAQAAFTSVANGRHEEFLNY